MKRSRLFAFDFRAAACAASASIGLAACGGGYQAAGPALPGTGTAVSTVMSSPRMNASGCGSSVVYVTSYNNSVYIYDQRRNHKTPCGQITGITNPQGLFVDKHRNLWVALAGNCRTQLSSVLEFAPGGTTPIETLQDSEGPATDVAVDNSSGTIYVTNFFNYSTGCASGNNGVVEVYAGGSTTPTSSLSEPNMNYAVNDAVDNAGNLYVTFIHLNGPTGNGQIDEWVGGLSLHNLGITMQAPGGIQTTFSGNLVVCDQSVACGDFAPNQTHMMNLFATKNPGALGIALDKAEKHAWVVNPGTGQLQRYAYPGPDSHPMQSITVPNGGYAGVAVSPPSPEGAPYFPSR
jgi:DNA-binding beta-propeller fold protein YncE